MNSVQSKGQMGWISLALMTIVAIDSLRALPIGAMYGASIVVYYLFLGLCFFIPSALVCAELASCWPESGGLYVWIKQAFGLRCATVAIWCQWFYNVVWFPSICIFLATTLCYVINPNIVAHRFTLLLLSTLLFMLATFLNSFGVKVNSIVSNITAWLGSLLPIFFIIALAYGWYHLHKPMAISFHAVDFLPKLNHISDLSILTGLVFGLFGMEVTAVHAGDVKKPQRNFPRALTFATIVILLTQIGGALAIAMVIPKDQLHLAASLMDAYVYFLRAFHIEFLSKWIAVAIFLGGLGGMSVWMLAPARGMMIAAQDGIIPQSLCKQNAHGAPIRLFIIQSIAFVVLSSCFAFFDFNQAYWLLSALTAQMAIIVYLLIFAAAIKLRFSTKERPRKFAVPGGTFGMVLVSGLGIVSLLIVMGFGFMAPADFHYQHPALFSIGLVVALVLLVSVALFLPCRDKVINS